ncbi:putative addiction module antidote protein, partial [Burkholderia thailandensis]|uniref:addiction module antidote protein n=1 Tax=Burkholderia thailandensis TaxID=57975 RepID=UPI00217E94B7
MKISELAEFDGSKYLKDEETIRHYLAQAFEDGNPRLIQAALGNVAKARGKRAGSHGAARVVASQYIEERLPPGRQRVARRIRATRRMRGADRTAPAARARDFGDRPPRRAVR